MGGDVAQSVERRTGTRLRQVRFPDAARCFFLLFFSRSQLSVQIQCINICAHVKDPGVHVRVRCITETPQHPAFIVGWVARLCRSWLSPGKSSPNFLWAESQWDYTVVKKQTNSSIEQTYLCFLLTCPRGYDDWRPEQ